jgi:hypothetical protein
MRAMDLREMVVDASLALARLDVDRLEELSVSCAALNRESEGPDGGSREAMIRQAQDAWHDMAVFARVLEATQANLAVLNQLRHPLETRKGYPARLGRGSVGRWGVLEEIDGND